MFHHHTENSPSTGEPPTPPLGYLTAEGSNRSESMSACEQSRQHQERVVPNLIISGTPSLDIERGRQDTIPSHDSGYERSPFNINLPNSPQFFMDLVFDEDSDDVVIEDDELCSDTETCCECQSSNSSATTMVQTPGSPPSSAFGYYCDICSCSSQQSSSSFQPPSSLPIEIPAVSSRRPTNTQQLPSVSFSWQRPPPSRSLPIEHSRTTRRLPTLQSFLSRSHPRTWPNVIMSMARLSSVDLLGGHRNAPTSSMSIRLRRIDSSFSSSIESFFDAAHVEPMDGDLDNVFEPESYEMTSEEQHPEYRRRLNSDVSAQPLPDLILQSSPRRNRSASVNLPPDHAVLRDIGRSLRRISDDFQTRMSGQQGTNNGVSPSCQVARPTFPVFTIFRRD